MTAASNHVHATIGYYQPKPDGTLPDVNDLALTLAFKDIDPREVVITDVRGKEDSYKLDEYGFEYLKHSTALEDFRDEGLVKSTYYKEIEELLKKRTGASKIIIFNHLIRSGNRPTPNTTSDEFLTGPPAPAPRVHIDQTPKGAEQLMKRLTPPEESERFLASRWQILNIWRPLKTIQRDPLAIADSRSIPDSDILPLRRTYDDGKDGENGVVKADGIAQHKWYYLSRQQPDEILLFKQHESDPGATSRGTPHSSFQLPGTQGLPNRESVEIRALVRY